MPAAPIQPEPELLIVGTLADVVEDQFSRLLSAMGVKRRLLPVAPRHALPAVGPTPVCCWPSPSWATPPARWRPAEPSASRRPSRSAPKAAPPGCAPEPPRPGPDAVTRAIAPARQRAEAALAPTAPHCRPAHVLLPRLPARTAAGALPGPRTRHAAGGGGHALSAPPAPGRGTGLAAGRHPLSEGQDVERSSTAAAPPGPTWSSAAWAWPIRWRPKA
jgi:hypothetical protein